MLLSLLEQIIAMMPSLVEQTSTIVLSWIIRCWQWCSYLFGHVMAMMLNLFAHIVDMMLSLIYQLMAIMPKLI